MRAGIVTIYDVENIGNRLQNYALQQTLLKYADQVITIKNKPKVSSALDNLKHASILAESIPLNLALGNKRKAKLLRFNRKFINITKKCYWYNAPFPRLGKEDRCDVYCAGSDQVWNPHYERDGMFSFLGFTEGVATFSYAASFGIEQIPEQFMENVQKGLNNIQYISVRENSGEQIVRQLTGRLDVQVLVDPTMLLTSQEWDRIAAKPSGPVPERYFLMYFLGPVSQERRQAILQKAESSSCKVIALMDKNDPYYDSGPEEFLYLIKHASMVCTDSFHGSVFSFLWQRPLAVFNRVEDCASTEDRLNTFVSKFHLESCIASQNRIPDVLKAPDYSAGYEELRMQRQNADAFLKKVFQSTENSSRS